MLERSVERQVVGTLPAPGADGRTAAAAPGEELLDRQARVESAARSYPRRLPVALARGRGVVVWDTAGRQYLDCLAGAGALALGHHHPAVVEAIQAALRAEVPLATLDLPTPLRDRFTEALLATVPASLADGRILFCGPTGADAVEAAIKLTRTATGRTGILAFGGAYHGMTAGALAATGARAPKAALGPLLPDVHHLPFPAAYRCPFGVGGDAGAELCGRLVDWALHDDHSGMTTPAAVLVEPVQGEGGVHPAPPAFARALRRSTAAAGVPLVVDEVQTGVGRTGAMWASEPLGLEPDVLVCSKAIGGGLPLAVIVHRADLDTWAPGAHAGTFRGNQLAMAAGAATLAVVRDAGLADHAAAMGERLLAGLRAVSADVPEVGDVRGRGLMVGVELVDPDRPDRTGTPAPDGALAARVQRALLDLGVLAEVGGREAAVLRFLPPLVITPDQVDRVVASTGAAVRRARAEHRP